jgi:hypothetical protein
MTEEKKDPTDISNGYGPREVEGVFKMPLTLADIENRSAGMEEKISMWKKKLARLELDLQKEQRQKSQMCKACFYLSGGLTTQAFTDKPCKRWGCHGRTKWNNGDTPDYCPDCATTMGICRRCGADQEYANRRSIKAPKRR